MSVFRVKLSSITFIFANTNPHPVTMTLNLLQVPIRTPEDDHANLIHHHISISLPALTPDQLTFFSFAAFSREVRLHFWTQHAGLPTTALRFCTHLVYERTASYDGTPAFLLHSPEHMDAAQPSRIACGDPLNMFILELNRVVWEDLQNPVVGLTALRVAIAVKIERILQKSLGSNQIRGQGKDILEDHRPATQGNVG
jgi:hypothetical protein